MKLFFGGTETIVREALRDGLIPGVRTHGAMAMAGREDCIYLSTVYAAYFAKISAGEGERWGIIEIETAGLCEEKLLPHEQYLVEITEHLKDQPCLAPYGVDDELQSVIDLEIKAKKEWFCATLEAYHQFWISSVADMGIAAYQGVIPVDAIARAAIVDPSVNPVIRESVPDTLTIIQHQTCKGHHSAVLDWIMGSRVDAWQLYGAGYELLTLSERQYIQSNLEMKRGCEHLMLR